MASEQKIALLKQWQDNHTRIEQVMDDLSKTVGFLGDSPLFDAVWRCWQDYTKALSTVVGDEEDWLSWYSMENDFGKKGYEAGYQDDLRPIRTLEDLFWLIDTETGSND